MTNAKLSHGSFSMNAADQAADGTYAPTHHITLRNEPYKVHWRAILAGSAVAVTVWLVLTILGVAVSLSMVDVDNATSVKHAALGTGVFGLLAPAVGCYVGALIAGRATRFAPHMSRAVTGMVMWAITTIVAVMMIGGAVTALSSGAWSVGSSAVDTAGSLAGGAAKVAGQATNPHDLARAFGLNAADALRPINARLHADGHPEITAQQLSDATREVIANAAQSGSIDKPMLVSAIADKTALSQADAQDIANRVQAQYEQAKAKLDQKVAEAKAEAIKAAQAAATATGKALLALVGAILLALIASIAGGILGGRRRYDADAPSVVVAPR